MSIAEYQVSLKNLIDETTDETLLKQWKTQLEADAARAKAKSADDSNAGQNATPQDGTVRSNDDTAGYDIVELGLGIDE